MKFKEGDHVYYYTRLYGHFPAQIEQIKNGRCCIENPGYDARNKFSKMVIWVNPSRLILQKEHVLLIQS